MRTSLLRTLFPTTLLAAACSWCMAVSCWMAIAEDGRSVREKLEKLPQPWKQRMHRLTPQEYEATLKYWAQKHPGLCTVEQIGTSSGGSPIFLVKITDSSVNDLDKQVALVSCTHSGPERSAVTTSMHLIQWLLGDSPSALQTRQRQIVLLLPVLNPESMFQTDRFGNAHGIDPYTGLPHAWNLETLSYPALDKAPEIAALLKVVDQYQPEVHIDLHGTGLQEYAPQQLGDHTMYQGQTMCESSGSAYSNYALRPWDWRVTETMVAAGAEAGFGSDRVEADAQRAFFGPAVQPIADRLWLGQSKFYTAQYGYAKYHTMLSTLEIGWEQSGLVRTRSFLEIGNRRWQGELAPGYPVDHVKPFVGHFLTAWGTNATERRQSRVELWQQQGRFGQALLYPQTDGRESHIVALSQQASKLLDSDKDRFLANLKDKELPGIDVPAIRAFFDVGPEIKLYVEESEPARWVRPHAIQHGLGIRLRLPYRQPRIADLRINGHAVLESPTDGYQQWYADGYTQLQLNLPPERARQLELIVVTCAYVGDEPRTTGWTPPQEVLDQLRTH